MLIALSLPMFATTVSADVLPNWDVTGDWVIQATLGSTYDHDFTLTMSPNGEFTGTGGYPAGEPYNIEETVTGTVNGDSITWTSVYYSGNVPYSWDFVGTIAADGTISGTWGNEDQGYGHDCISISGIAQPAIISLTLSDGSPLEASIQILTTGDLPDCIPALPLGVAGEFTPYIDVTILASFEGTVTVKVYYEDMEDEALEESLKLYMGDCVDFNLDGTINGKDLAIIKKAIETNDYTLPSKFDVNNDKEVNQDDVDIVKEYMTQGLIVNQLDVEDERSQARLPWLDITIEVNTDENFIIGETDHFSIFRGR